MKSSGRKFIFLILATAIFFIARGITKPTAAPEPSAGLTNPKPQVSWDELMIGSQKALKDNDLEQAVFLCNQAMGMARDFGARDTRYSKSEVQRGEIYCWQTQPEEAERMFKNAIADCEKVAGANSLELVFPVSSLANFYTFVSVHPDRVSPLLLRVLNIERNSPAHKETDVIMWLRNVGESYQAQREYGEAEPYFEQAVDLAGKIDRNDWLPHELLTAADFYRAWGKYDSAEALGKRALAIREEELGNSRDVDKKMDVTVCLDNLGETYLAEGKADRAEAAYRRSVAMAETFMSADQSDYSPRLLGLATALRDEGKFDAAGPFFERALGIAEKNAGADSKDVADILEKYAALLRDQHKAGDADGMLKRAADIRAKLGAKGG